MKDYLCDPTDLQTKNQTAKLNILRTLLQFSPQGEPQLDLRDLLTGGKHKSLVDGDLLMAPCETSQPNWPESCDTLNDRQKRLPRCWRKTCKKNEEVTSLQTPSDIIDSHITLQQQLALTALNLTAPACSSVLQSQRKNWVQLSGHPGSLTPAGPATIWKKQPSGVNEASVYEALMTDNAKDIVPKFYREVTYEGERFIELSDLLYGFDQPNMMDVKIGSRTFLESEVANKKPRKDLYLKMTKVDPEAPTCEEKENESITKLRYMEFRDMMSSSRTLAFRVEALKMSGSSSVMELKKVRSKTEVVEVLSNFVQKRDSIRKRILSRLQHIRNTFERSAFFSKHEVIGSSILIVWDEHRCGAWVIDFAKTSATPVDFSITHRHPWQLGNREEQYLTGIENLMQCFKEAPVLKSRRIKFFGKN